MASKSKSKSGDRFVYQEFGYDGDTEDRNSVELDVVPNQQNLKVEVSRKGRKGKTVTVVQGFQHSQETLSALLKQLKTHCGAGGTLKEQTVEIQGDHGQKVMTFLSQKGYKVKRSGG
ncbi:MULTISPECIES: translation initiation factor [unclassified Roseofilum]|uniref:translation initiation factor n=1 Tax=unclassified Roseofilum TaxID=2620099 RepID=UPI000E91ACAD|nr:MULTISPECIES: translation initiation factor [unclassified Roseofilum]MBP0007502.1 translation initiation factor [Roseofilum sp. Belize Diploria]MBP0031780.1 translation initiation factor [Roseofilum sp. Belize BBD 4]HBQ99030.1 stress response translation initiation inhibitor YciH [Cyanobacteria bacterium UBA11691]